MSKAAARTFPLRKRYLYDQHVKLLQSHPMSLLVQFDSLTVQEMNALRAQLKLLSTPAKLQVLRPGLLSAIIKNKELEGKVDLSRLSQKGHSSGPLCAISSEQLDPPSLSKVLQLIDKFGKPKEDANQKKTDPNAEPPRRRMELASSLLEFTAKDLPQTQEVAKLPPLSVLHQQILGVVSSPASQLVGLLSTPPQSVLLTLEGYKKGLEGEK